jgi:mono/diheme cytochrome c family protein
MRSITASLAALACVGALAVAAPNVTAQTAADETFDGAWRYHVSCAGCHDDDGSGVYAFGPPLKGNKFVQSAPAAVIIQVIQEGRNYEERNHLAYVGMPAFHYIRGGEAEALVNFLKGDLQNGEGGQ